MNQGRKRLARQRLDRSRPQLCHRHAGGDAAVPCRQLRDAARKPDQDDGEPLRLPQPHGRRPGFEAMRKQQEAFLKTMMGGMPGWGGSGPAREEEAPRKGRRHRRDPEAAGRAAGKALQALTHGRTRGPRHAHCSGDRGLPGSGRGGLGLRRGAASGRQPLGRQPAGGGAGNRPRRGAARPRDPPLQTTPPAPCSAATPRSC